MQYFGYTKNNKNQGYPLATWIWGHRLIQGQHWMEYLLEFLNVFAGFEYKLGKGITQGTSTSEPETYNKFTRVGLRRFVFYDEREKTQHAFDTEALQRLKEVLLAEKMASTGSNKETVLESVRTLLRSFAAIEEQRSWYAKALFPAHHNFLFWEARRDSKAARKVARMQPDPTEAEADELDRILAYDGRNFFARGGELYYLILSAGTQASPERRTLIVERLEYLLTGHNQALGKLAHLIDQTWQEALTASNGDQNKLKGKLGWIPDPDCAFYQLIAEDVENFLRADLDQLEALTLFAHLIGFHLTLYIYHRAHPEATSERHKAGTCLDQCRLGLLIDGLEGADGGVVRRVSAALFRKEEEQIKQKGKEYIHQQVEKWIITLGKNGSHISALSSEARHHFNERAWGKRLKNEFTAKENSLLTQYNEGKLTQSTFSEKYAGVLFDILKKNFSENFLGVHRKLSKGIGFVAPRTGTGARYVLGDNMLKALTLAMWPPGSSITYDRFLALLYERYGLVVGSIEAKQSGLFERQRINSEYYERNKAALLAKLKFAGLAVEYSDATAMVGLIDS